MSKLNFLEKIYMYVYYSVRKKIPSVVFCTGIYTNLAHHEMNNIRISIVIFIHMFLLFSFL